MLTVLTPSSYGQEVKKCDGTIVLFASNKAGQLTPEEIREFLFTFGKECRNNVEFSEFSNEVLFAVLYTQTALTLRTMEKEKKLLELDEIMDDLSSPINDSISVKKLIPRVEEARSSGKIKNQVLERLREADAKSY